MRFSGSRKTTSAALERPTTDDKKRSLKKLKSLGPRILRLALPHWAMISIGMLALLLGSGINLFFPYLIRSILNEQSGFNLERDLTAITLLLITLFLVQGVFFYYRHYCFQVVGLRIVTALRTQLFRSTLLQDISFFDSARLGDLLSRLSSDSEVVQRALTVNISVALRYSVQVIGGIILMLYLSPKLTVAILLVLPLLVGASSIWAGRLRKLSKRMQAELGDATVSAEEALNAVRTVRIFASEPYETARYDGANQTALRTGTQRTRIAALFSSSMVVLMHSAIAAVIWFGGTLVLAGELSLGDLTAFLLYCVIVAVSFGFLAGTWIEFLQAVGAGERIFEIIDSPPLIGDAPAPKKLPHGMAIGVVFRKVNFHYPSREEIEVLQDITFEIGAGKTVALVGPSGSGKSTIAALIARLYDPQSGEIFVGNVPLPSVELASLRKEISFVPQQPQVFSSSIRDNIRYGSMDASEADIERAATAANLHRFISSLPAGYDTLVGDKGIQLSGGEKQRVAIARAILRNPRLLILDEATSSLDSENEKLVSDALQRLMVGRTVLIIAHRLSTVKHADSVIVLKDGIIIQQGSHGELVDIPGLYRTLVEHQVLV